MKQNLLIAYANPYIFYETLYPILEELSVSFKIDVILTADKLPRDLEKSLYQSRKEGHLDNYDLLPSTRDRLSLIDRALSLKKEIQYRHYDIILKESDTSWLAKYIHEVFQFKDSREVCLVSSLGYNMMNFDFVKTTIENAPTPWDDQELLYDMSASQNDQKALLMKLRERNLFKVISNRINVFFSRKNKQIGQFLNFSVFPYILFKKKFLVNNIENQTKSLNGNSDLYLFVDSFEAEVMQKLLPSKQFNTITYPSINKGMKIEKNKNSLLLALSTGYCSQDKLPHNYLEELTSNIEHICTKHKIKSIDLKLHPRETHRWPFHLQEVLTKKGFKVGTITVNIPIRKVLSSYSVFLSFASTTLRDASAAFPRMPIYGLESASRPIARTISPKGVLNVPLWFGTGPKITWINSHNKEIRAHIKHHNNHQINLPDLLINL